ncbi:unnamed protein product [Urochloa humidicola]
MTCGLVSMTFVSLAGDITMCMPGCFVVYAGVAVAAWVFVYLRLQETRGRSWRTWRCSLPTEDLAVRLVENENIELAGSACMEAFHLFT